MWGKRRMAYSIRKQREGQYVYIETQFAPSFSAELERNLRFVEPIMRYLDHQQVSIVSYLPHAGIL